MAFPAREWVDHLATMFKVPPQRIAESFRAETMKSDYSFMKDLFEFTPGKMHYWAWSPQVHYREQFLLSIKSSVLANPASTGIFNVQNQDYKGFQQGDPQERPDGILVHLYSDSGSVELVFYQKTFQNPAGITQPEINRMIQSLRKSGNISVSTDSSVNSRLHSPE
jgi:hypothetical protein